MMRSQKGPLNNINMAIDASVPAHAVHVLRGCAERLVLLGLAAVFAFEMVGSSIYTVTSVLTQRELDLFCSTYNIPAGLRPELPDRNSTIKDSPEGKIGIYTRFIEFANYRFPLSKFLLYVHEYYQISLSQLSVIGAAKVSHFEIMCSAFGRIPTVGTIRRFYVNSVSNGWLSFSKRGGAGDPCCVSKKFDSLKNWNNHFFWIDASVCPLSLLWFDGTSVVKDPLPMDEAVDLPCAELLNENRTLIRKYPETFLCLLGLSRSFVEMDVRPTFLRGDNEEMGLLDFVRAVDPFKDELNVNSGKKKKMVAFASGSLPAKKARIEGIVISDSQPSIAGKSISALQILSRQNEQASTGSGSAAPVTEDVTSSSATHTPDFAHEDASHDNVRTRSAPVRFVVISSKSTDADIPASSQVVPPVTLDSAGATAPVAASTGGDHPPSDSGPEAGALSATPSQDSSADDFYESQTIDSAAAQNIYVPNRNDAMFLDTVNVNSAQHVCMVSELRLRYEYEITIREKFEKKFTNSVVVVQQRDAEIADLNARLEKSEAEAAEVADLRKRVCDLEAMVTVKVGELANLHTKNVGLAEKVFALELERDGLKDQVVVEDTIREEFLSQQDAAEQRFKERVAELDARIADVRRDMDDDLYPYMLTAIAGRRWVVGHGFRLAVHKCAKSIECQSALGKIEAYDPKVEGKYVDAVFEFEGLSFPLLDELEGLKDSHLASIMSALTLKDSECNKDISFKLSQFQPSLDQVTVPIYSESGSICRKMPLSDGIPSIRRPAERRGLCPPSGAVPGETSGSVPPHDSSLAVADYQVSTLVLSGDGASADQSPIVEPHDDLFDASVLDKPADV
ncbi:hypothetical protein Tco_0485285 [Tanacetum coccineum]